MSRSRSVVQGYCQAVRAALTEDGRPPLDAPGLKLHYSIEVLRGSVQLVAAVATRLAVFTAQDLVMVSVTAWQKLRSQLEQHRLKRIKQRQFRLSPTTYLSELEAQLLQLGRGAQTQSQSRIAPIISMAR